MTNLGGLIGTLVEREQLGGDRPLVQRGARWFISAGLMAVLTLICVNLQLNSTTAAFAYLVLIVLVSLTDGLLSSAIFSVLAVLSLNYFFVEPRFTFRVEYGSDLLTLTAFVVTSLVITSLTRQVRSLDAAHREQVRLLELTRQLQQAQTELAHATRVTTLGEMTASIAHEVNQPLASIVTSGEAALRFLDSDPPRLDGVRDALMRIIADGARAGTIVHQIRTLTGKSADRKTAISMNTLINDSVTLIQGELSEHRAELKLELWPDLPQVLGDRVQLQQVVINLLINGIQAMAAVQDHPRELVVTTSPNPDGLVGVSVRDAGVGVDPDHASKLFDAFFTTKANGMGMGLTICRTIIEAHGGRLWASPNPDGGATFQFSVPSAAA